MPIEKKIRLRIDSTYTFAYNYHHVERIAQHELSAPILTLLTKRVFFDIDE